MSNDVLSNRETQVMWLVAEGLSNKLIAARLEITPHTVKFHITRACKKLRTTNRTRAAVNFILMNNTISQEWLAHRANLAAPMPLVEAAAA